MRLVVRGPAGVGSTDSESDRTMKSADELAHPACRLRAEPVPVLDDERDEAPHVRALADSGVVGQTEEEPRRVLRDPLELGIAQPRGEVLPVVLIGEAEASEPGVGAEENPIRVRSFGE